MGTYDQRKNDSKPKFTEVLADQDLVRPLPPQRPALKPSSSKAELKYKIQAWKDVWTHRYTVPDSVSETRVNKVRPPRQGLPEDCDILYSRFSDLDV